MGTLSKQVTAIFVFTAIVSNVQQIQGFVPNVTLAMEFDKCKIITTKIVLLAQLQTAGTVPLTIKSVRSAKMTLDSMNKTNVFSVLRTARNVFIKQAQQIKLNKYVFIASKDMDLMSKVYVNFVESKIVPFVKILVFVFFAKMDMG